MEQLQVHEILSMCYNLGFFDETELLNIISERIPGEAYVYALLDYAVALGLSRNGNIEIGLGLEKKVIELPVAYLHELRVFDETRELRAIRVDGKFLCRVRCDCEQGDNIAVFDETRKLWGSVQKEEDRGQWSVLRSNRGSAISFPGEVNLHGEKGLKVRNYINFYDACLGDGLMHFVDERLCGFVDWHLERGGKGHDVV